MPRSSLGFVVCCFSILIISVPSSLVGGGVDTDMDGVEDAVEMVIGTDPENVDSDCDGKDDGSEVGPNLLVPLDLDGDGLIDALESRWVDSDGDNSKDDVDGTSGWQFACGRFIPFAVKDDESDSTRLEVRIVGGTSITSVVVDTLSFFSDVKVDGVTIPTSDGIELFDDGTEGDRVAGDGIFTRDGITSSSSTTAIREREFDKIRVTDGGVTSEEDLDTLIGFTFDRIKLAIVDPTLVETPLPAAPNAQVVSNAVNLIDPLGMTQVKRYLMADVGVTLQAVTQNFYGFAPDDYDWLMMLPESQANRGNSGVAFQIKNDVQGIGQGLFDATAGWGSAGRLASVTARNLDEAGPTLHELLHRFAVDLSPSLGFQSCQSTDHWGVAGVGEGQLGGFNPATLVDGGGGNYTVDFFSRFAGNGDNVPYAPIELYLAGLIPPEEVPDMPVPQTINCASFGCNAGECNFSAVGMNTLTIDDIIAFHGPRIPDSTTSQKAFSTAVVAVSQYPLNASEMAFFNYQATNLAAPSIAGGAHSFEEATGGRATMNTTHVTIPVYRSTSPTSIVDPANRIGAAFGSPFVDATGAGGLQFYKVDDGAGSPASITLAKLPSGNPEIRW